MKSMSSNETSNLEDKKSFMPVARVSGKPSSIEKQNGKLEGLKDFDFEEASSKANRKPVYCGVNSSSKQIEPGEQETIADEQDLDKVEDNSHVSVSDDGVPDNAPGKALNTEVLGVEHANDTGQLLFPLAAPNARDLEEVAPVAEMHGDRIPVSQSILSIGIQNADVIRHAHPRARERFQIPLKGHELPSILVPTGQITVIPRPRDPDHTHAFEPGERTSPFGVRLQLGGGYAQELIPQDAILPTERSLKLTVGPCRRISSVHVLLGNYHRVENNWLLCRIDYEVRTKYFSSELLLSARIDCLGNVCISLMDYTTLRKYSWLVTNIFDVNMAADPIVEEVDFFADMMNEEFNEYADFDTFL